MKNRRERRRDGNKETRMEERQEALKGMKKEINPRRKEG